MQVKLLMGASFDVASREVSGDQTGRMLESKGCKGTTMKTEVMVMVNVAILRMRMAWRHFIDEGGSVTDIKRSILLSFDS